MNQSVKRADEDLFFVLGAPKSGTTWLQKLLAAHPELSCKGEGKFLFFRNRLIEGMTKYGVFLQNYNDAVFGERLFPVIGEAEFERLFRAFIETRVVTDTPASARRVGCKDPELGLYMASTAAMFPKASYIHLVRDPRDVAVSAWGHTARTDSRFSQTPPEVKAVVSQSTVGWANYVRGVQATAATTGIACHQLRYEDLLAAPAETLAAVLRFLDVSAEAGLVARCLDAASFERATGGRAQGEEDVSSFYRKGVVGDWRNHLDEAESRACLDATQGLAASLGYD
jgi:LPS sulfotransferase NodH